MAAQIDPGTSIGTVSLTVADLDRACSFYERAIGLQTLRRDPGEASLGTNETALVRLISDPAAPPRPPGTTGLFHLAILVPDRAELARSLRRVADAGGRLSGASDHFVSEALYLDDPEGNGIEIYRDRPRREWETVGGELKMGSVSLDLDGLLASTPAAAAPVAGGTRMGHVHLNVADLADAESFYCGLLGFEVTVRSYPGALFVSAGAYHHHLGLNTWAGEGAKAPPPGARGLQSFEVVLPGPGPLEDLAGRLQASGVQTADRDGVLEVADPFGNRVRLRSDRAQDS